MKQPSIPLTIAYKVVQVDQEGHMWSVNLGLSLRSASDVLSDRLIRYRLRHQVLPNTQVPWLFICPNKKEAIKTCHFYSSGKTKYILRGYAADYQLVTAASPSVKIGNCMFPLLSIVPKEFQSAICSSFIPIGIVYKQRPYKKT